MHSYKRTHAHVRTQRSRLHGAREGSSSSGETSMTLYILTRHSRPPARVLALQVLIALRSTLLRPSPEQPPTDLVLICHFRANQSRSGRITCPGWIVAFPDDTPGSTRTGSRSYFEKRESRVQRKIETWRFK